MFQLKLIKSIFSGVNRKIEAENFFCLRILRFFSVYKMCRDLVECGEETLHWLRCTESRQSRRNAARLSANSATELCIDSKLRKNYDIEKAEIVNSLFQFKVNIVPTAKFMYKNFLSVCPRRLKDYRSVEVKFRNPRATAIIHLKSQKVQIFRTSQEKIARGIGYKILKRLRKYNENINSSQVIFPNIVLRITLNNKINLNDFENNYKKNIFLGDINNSESRVRAVISCKRKCNHIQKYCFSYNIHSSGIILVYLKNVIDFNSIDLPKIIHEIMQDAGNVVT